MFRNFGAGVAAVALSVAALAAASPPAPGDASDRITWIRADGAPGWEASIARETQPQGRTATPLFAPVWFPHLPPLTLTLAAGGTLDLAGARGRVVLLDFWASWCGPCLMELPHLQRLHTKEAPRGLLAIAVNADEPQAVAAASAKRLGLTMAVAINDPKLYQAFSVRTLPTLLAIDKQGRVRARWDGYRPGLETTIGTTVAKLIDGSTEATQVEIASVLAGAGTFRAIWARELSGTTEGVVVLPPAAGEKARVIVSGGGAIVTLDRRGELTGRRQAPSWAGRLLDAGRTASGGWGVAGFRPGATSVGVFELGAGSAREITLPGPLRGLAVDGGAEPGGRRLAAATLAGLATGGVAGGMTLIGGTADANDVATRPEGGFVTLAGSGAIATLGPEGPPWPTPAKGAERLVASFDQGAAVGPRTVVAAAAGRFLPGRARQLAVATYAGHLVLLDAKTGTTMLDAIWADVRDLASGDLDGDGLDELVVAAGHQVTALSAATAAGAAPN